jgi:uncharacterized repeat protein (TIGR01451 family)
MTAYAGQAEQKGRRRWAILLVLLLLGGVVCLGGVLFSQQVANQELEFVPVHLHSELEADYKVNPNPPQLPGVRLDIIWQAIFDHEPEATGLEARQAALLNSLQTPVPFVTPQVCQGEHTIYVSQDTWLDSANPTATYGSDTLLQIGRDENHLKRLLLYFSLEPYIPQGTFISSARLELNAADAAVTDASQPIHFFNLMNPFQEATTNWSNQPELGIADFPPKLRTANIHAWDVTDIVRAWLLGHYPNHGLGLEPQSSTTATLFYYSREADSQTNREVARDIDRLSPRLIIDCGGAPLPEAIAAASPTIIPNPTNTPGVSPTNTPIPQLIDTPPLPTPSPIPAVSSPTLPPTTPTIAPTTPAPLPSPTNSPPPSSTSPNNGSPDDDPTDTPVPAPTPLPSANLVVSKTGAPNPVIVGNNLTYTLNVSNNGPSDATGVTVVDTLPAGVSLISATPSQGTGCSGTTTITCNLGLIANGNNATVTIVVSPSTTGILTNSATASASETDPNPGDNTATANTTVNPAADLKITKAAAPDPALAGSSLTYTLTVTNAGPSDATGVVITDTLPGGITFVSASAGCTQAGGIVTCNVGNLTAGSSLQRIIVVTVNPATTGPLTNQATVGGNEADPAGGDNTATIATSVIPLADLSVSKSVDKASPTENDTIVYTVVVVNNGPANATGVVVNDTLPSGVTYVSDNSGGAYSSGAWSVGALNNGSSATLIITATVDAGTVNTTITNTATIGASGQTDSNTSNNTASAAITVVPTLSINDVTVTEGNAGTVSAVFTVTLSSASSQVVTVDYTTADGTATLADNDYVSTNNTLTFLAGTTVQTLTVPVNGDTVGELDEIFFVTLSSPTNATIVDNQGVGTILNDDGASLCSSPTVTLTTTGDTWLQESAPTTNQGADTTLRVKPDSSVKFRTLVQFDLSSIPPGTLVKCAALLLYENNTSADQTIHIHQTNASWLESQATWNNRTAANPWATAGGDYNASPTASFLPDATGLRIVEITSLAQFWVDNPGANFGLLLRSTTLSDNADVQFKSLEDGTDPPRLVVNY